LIDWFNYLYIYFSFLFIYFHLKLWRCLITFFEIVDFENKATWKSGLEVIQGHGNPTIR